MALGKYHIQIQYDFDPPEKWRNDCYLQYLGKDFARGAFYVLKNKHLNERKTSYRLVKSDQCPDWTDSIEVLDTYTHRSG